MTIYIQVCIIHRRSRPPCIITITGSNNAPEGLANLSNLQALRYTKGMRTAILFDKKVIISGRDVMIITILFSGCTLELSPVTERHRCNSK